MVVVPGSEIVEQNCRNQNQEKANEGCDGKDLRVVVNYAVDCIQCPDRPFAFEDADKSQELQTGEPRDVVRVGELARHNVH